MSNHNPSLSRSRRLASVISASDWRRAGCNHLESVVLEKLQTDKKNILLGDDVFPAGETFSGVIILIPRNNEAQLIWKSGGPVGHHELMLPHWENFATALVWRKEVKFLTAAFHLPPPVLVVILPSMQNMKQIYFMNSGLGSAGFCCLSSFLRQNSTLLLLSIVTEEIDADMAGLFSEALNNHPTLEHLGLANCGLDT